MTSVYDKYAATYDKVWANFSRNSHARIAAALDLSTIAHLLDVGAGTGALLHKLAAALPVSAQLAGIEPSPGMIREARHKLHNTPNVKLVQASADSLPFADAIFDAVISANVFHYLRDPSQALAEMRRVLKPGGQLVLEDYRRHPAPIAQIVHVLDRGHVRSYRADDVANLVRAAGFAVTSSNEFPITRFWGGWLVAAHR